MPIHHAIIKKAERLGLSIEEQNGAYVLVTSDEERTDTFPNGAAISAALAAYEADPDSLAFLEPEPADETEDTPAFAKCGVMAKHWHDLYESNPHGPGCGDKVDMALRDAYTHSETGLDRDAIKECAAQLWNPKYDSLNNGQVRMNVGNKIRGLLRNNAEATWTIGQHTGRFGIVYNPPKRKTRKIKAEA